MAKICKEKDGGMNYKPKRGKRGYSTTLKPEPLNRKVTDHWVIP